MCHDEAHVRTCIPAARCETTEVFRGDWKVSSWLLESTCCSAGLRCAFGLSVTLAPRLSVTLTHGRIVHKSAALTNIASKGMENMLTSD